MNTTQGWQTWIYFFPLPLVCMSLSMSPLFLCIPRAQCSSRCLSSTALSPDTFPSLICAFKQSRDSLHQDRFTRRDREAGIQRWMRPPAHQLDERKGRSRAELLRLFRIFPQNFTGTTEERGRIEEKIAEMGRVSRLKIKERHKAPKREKKKMSEMPRENVLLCIREKREKRSQCCMKKNLKNVDIILQKLTTELTFPYRAYIEICQSGGKK